MRRWDVIELILESDWHTFFRRQNISWSATDTVSDKTGGITDTGNTQWTDSSHCQPSVSVIHSFMGVFMGYVNMRHPMLLKALSYLACSCLSWNYVTVAARVKQMLSTKRRSQDNVVCVVTGMCAGWSRVRLPTGTKDFPLLQNVHMSLGPTKPIFSGYWHSFLGVKQFLCEVWPPLSHTKWAEIA